MKYHQLTKAVIRNESKILTAKLKIMRTKVANWGMMVGNHGSFIYNVKRQIVRSNRDVNNRLVRVLEKSIERHFTPLHLFRRLLWTTVNRIHKTQSRSRVPSEKVRTISKTWRNQSRIFLEAINRRHDSSVSILDQHDFQHSMRLGEDKFNDVMVEKFQILHERNVHLSQQVGQMCDEIQQFANAMVTLDLVSCSSFLPLSFLPASSLSASSLPASSLPASSLSASSLSLSS
jgi:hypothetical protein